jgi:hypothetical protein
MYADKNRLGEVNLTGGGFILFWAFLIFIVILISIFFHEVGHGIGFRMTGIHYLLLGREEKALVLKRALENPVEEGERDAEVS